MKSEAQKREQRSKAAAARRAIRRPNPSAAAIAAALGPAPQYLRELVARVLGGKS